MIRKAQTKDAATIAALAYKMWTSTTEEVQKTEFEDLLLNEDAAIFLYLANGTAIGFAQCQLRRDYVEGTATSPVGYLEGVFVESDYRRQGYGRKLVDACVDWAKSKGCTEFASDCELHNTESQAFHLHSGFCEVNRIICFTKKIG